ncbi:uncharacterized protein LOC143047112 [Mytilus galloprovincialis]|uniref:uncharacterized protein LOC143047112 n=1 Tax=Mytilus galloprovincialis TaxID=29158 RepID=UPI003F7BD6C2
MRSLLLLCLAVPVVSGFVLDSFGLSTKVNTVSELDVAKYLGRWYQMYASESVYATFERGAQCVTADYSLKPGVTNNITVLNSETVDSPTSPLTVTHGYALPSDKPGQLTVVLETAPLPAPYWVLKLGPKTFGTDGQYQYSIVSDFLKATLFVLARDTTTFKTYEPEILQFLKEQGFTSIINKPVKTYHGSDCHYNPKHQ